MTWGRLRRHRGSAGRNRRPQGGRDPQPPLGACSPAGATGIGPTAGIPPRYSAFVVEKGASKGRLEEPQRRRGECDPVPSVTRTRPATTTPTTARTLRCGTARSTLVDIDRLLGESADVERLGDGARSGPGGTISRSSWRRWATPGPSSPADVAILRACRQRRRRSSARAWSTTSPACLDTAGPEGEEPPRRPSDVRRRRASTRGSSSGRTSCWPPTRRWREVDLTSPFDVAGALAVGRGAARRS